MVEVRDGQCYFFVINLEYIKRQKVSIERHIMSKQTGGWNGYDPCESGGGAGKKWGRFGSVEKFGKSVIRRVCRLSG